MPRILLLDDDAHLADGGLDAVTLDVMPLEMDGFALCCTIRRRSDVPIPMPTACGWVLNRVGGLERGADDCLPETLEPRALIALLQTVLRRQPAEPAPTGAVPLPARACCCVT